jgi:hypothetical protein
MNGKPRGIVRSRLPQAAAPTMTTITIHGAVRGFVLRRFDSHEAFNRDGKPIGIFADLESAADAVRRRKEQAP